MSRRDVLEIEISKMLPVPLTKEEQEKLIDNVGEYRDKVLTLEADKKDTAKRFSDQITRAQTLMDEALTDLRRGVVDKPVACKKILDYKGGGGIIIRCDTGEVVTEWTLSQQERQQVLDMEPPEPEPTLSEINQARIDEEWAAYLSECEAQEHEDEAHEKAA